MKFSRRAVVYILYLLLGITLWVLSALKLVGAFWAGMGTALVFLSILRLGQMIRMLKDDDYRENVETETYDERNRFIRTKAWAWVGYLFFLIVAVCVIVLKIIGFLLFSTVAFYALCLMLLLYWGAYLILRKKY